MKRSKLLISLLTIMLIGQFSFAQNQSQRFKMVGSDPEMIVLDQTINVSTEIDPFDKNVNKVFGLAVSADIKLVDENSMVSLILVDKNFEEYLIYETNYLLAEEIGEFSIEEICEETSILNNVKVGSIRIEIVNASIHLKNLTYNRAIRQGINFVKVKKEKKQEQNVDKITRINKKLKEKGKTWVAGPTGVSELTYSEKKKLFGQSTFPAGFEYYAGGVISTSTNENRLKSTSSSPYIDEWDWRDRHGKNWITPVTDQKLCGSCWAFATVGATEAMVNVYYNQILNLDLSEQDVLSCSGAGDCNGGYPSTALNYIAGNGVVNEGAFPYSATDQTCGNKDSQPTEHIRIGGRIDYGNSKYPKTEDILKKMLIEFGPMSSGVSNWGHTMVLVGYKVVKEGDVFYTRDLESMTHWKSVAAGDPLIGKTVWVFKNSWGGEFGDDGYVYVETDISNIGWTHALDTPFSSDVKKYEVVCEDRDGDGYYWWGIGPKPATCQGPDQPDGNDADPTLGPLDEYGFCTVISGAPVVAISVDRNSITLDETVNFTDLSTNNPTSWNWTFAGGNPSTSESQTPSVIYNSSGTYDVTLMVTNDKGTSTKIFTNYITVLEPIIAPLASFTSDKTVISQGETINFSDLSTNNPTSWSWSFNGGNPAISTLKNPAVRYDNPGTYDVTLKVTNSAGSVTKTVSNYVTVIEDIPEYCISSGNANDEWIASVQLGANIKNSISSATIGYQDFTGTVFTADAGSIQNLVLTPEFSRAGKKEYWRVWIDYNCDLDFDDNSELVYSSRSSSKTVEGSFIIPSGLNITTRMRVSLKRSSTASQCEIFSLGEVEDYSIAIGAPVPKPPVAEFMAAKTNVLVGESVQFTDLSENEPSQWEWSFSGGNPSTSNQKNPVVSYTSQGEYDVSLTVSKPGFNPVKKIKQKYIVSVENSISEYCVPVGINSTSDFIKSISLGTFNNSSEGDGYTLYPNQIELSNGQSYSVTFSPADNSNRNFWRLWIDFNGDGDFEDTGENLIALNNKKGSVTANFITPTNATGTTRMRIAMKNSKAPSNCEGNFDGEIEDYIVSFEPRALNFNLVMTSTSIIEQLKGYKIFPNPSAHIVNIEIESVLPGDFLEVYDLNGKKLISQKITERITKINLTNLSHGIYPIFINNGSRLISEKIVKK